MPPAKSPIAFVTSNANKIREAERLLGIHVVPLVAELEEIQSGAIETIARRKLSETLQRGRDPVFVEDVSLGFDELGGFPGPFIKWLLESAGGEGLGKIASGLSSRRASASCCIAFWDGSAISTFLGETQGTILSEPRGSREFGWDAWFQPEGFALTYGEMSSEVKDSCSHRARAYAKFRQHLRSSL